MCDLIAFPREVDESNIKFLLGMEKFAWEDAKDTHGHNTYLEDPDNVLLDSFALFAAWEYEPFKKIFKNQFVYHAIDCYGNFKECEDMIAKSGISKEDIYYYSTLGRIDLAYYQKGRNRKGVDVYKLREERDKIINTLKQIDAVFVLQAIRYAKQFYDLVKLNTKIGETVEVYTCWYGLPSYKVPKPKEIRKINVDQILSPDVFYCKDRIKTEILNI